MAEIENKINENKVIRENNTFEVNNDEYNNIYGQEYFDIESKLSSIKEDSKLYFESFSNQYSQKYEKLTNKYHSYFAKLSEKIKNVFELKSKEANNEKAYKKQLKIIQNYSKEYLKKFNKILIVHEQIFDNIKQNMNILLNYFDIMSEAINLNNPINLFLDKELKNIINNWMFLKISSENYNIRNVIENKEIDKKFKKFLFDVCENKNYYKYVNPLKYENDKASEYSSDKNNLRLNEIKISNCQNYFNKDVSYPNLKSLYIKKSFFENNIIEKFPNIEKIYINSCYRINIGIFETLSNNITELNLDKNGFINSDFIKIFSEYIMKNDNIRKKIKYLSFKDNNINKVDFNQIVFNAKYTFHSLQEVDFSENKIYKFLFEPQFFPSLKIINLCYNNFSTVHFKEFNNILIMQSGNPFLLDDTLCLNYYSELEKKLNRNFPPTKNLCISYIPKNISINFISSIKIGTNFLINLTYLDLSFNHITSETFFYFIENNKRCLNIKHFNLTGNELNDTFFVKFIFNKYYEIFDKLEILNLNLNFIGDDSDIDYEDNITIEEKFKLYEKIIHKLRLIYDFIKLNKNLKQLSVTRNPLCEYFKIKEVSEDEIDENLFYDENDKIKINGFNSFLLKIKNELNPEVDTERKQMNIIFDCDSDINKNSSKFDFEHNLIIYKNKIQNFQ